MVAQDRTLDQQEPSAGEIIAWLNAPIDSEKVAEDRARHKAKLERVAAQNLRHGSECDRNLLTKLRLLARQLGWAP